MRVGARTRACRASPAHRPEWRGSAMAAVLFWGAIGFGAVAWCFAVGLLGVARRWRTALALTALLLAVAVVGRATVPADPEWYGEFLFHVTAFVLAPLALAGLGVVAFLLGLLGRPRPEAGA